MFLFFFFLIVFYAHYTYADVFFSIALWHYNGWCWEKCISTVCAILYIPTEYHIIYEEVTISSFEWESKKSNKSKIHPHSKDVSYTYIDTEVWFKISSLQSRLFFDNLYRKWQYTMTYLLLYKTVMKHFIKIDVCFH